MNKLALVVGTILLIALPAPAAVQEDRHSELIALVFDQFPSIEVPPTTIEVIPFGKFEERIAQLEAGGGWQTWVRSFRSQTDWMIGAYTIKAEADAGVLHIVTYEALNDRVLIHEVMHVAMSWLEVVGPGDRPVLNDEQMVQKMTANFILSKRYRAWLRERG
jgi:hypothetical protein